MAKYLYTVVSHLIFRPLISIKISNPQTRKITNTPINALIDSGADSCLIASYISEFLEISSTRKRAVEFITANGSRFKAYKVNLVIHFARVSFEVPFYVSRDLPPENPIILGQTGFFNRYKVRFDFVNKEMELIYNFSN